MFQLLHQGRDAVGARLWDITLRPTAPKPETDLKARADRVAARVTGLLEPLKLIEVDAPRRTAQLRSEEPAQKGSDLLYYELLLQGDGTAQVRRFKTSSQASPRREQTGFAMNHEALIKLVDDLLAD